MAHIGPYLAAQILGSVFSMAAASLLRDDPDEPLVDEKPTTLASRGSRHPQVIGRRRVAPILCYAGGRERIPEEGESGGKGYTGTSGQEQDVWYEQGWHIICVGPGQRLYRIFEDGEEVFSTEMSVDTNISGSTFELNGGYGNGGSSGRIYWGEKDQPSNLLLDSLTGLASRWPYVMYIMWDKKRLGGFPRWPAIEYEVETWPYRPSMDNVLGNRNGFLEGADYPVTHPARLTQSAPLFSGTVLAGGVAPATRRVTNGTGSGAVGAQGAARLKLAKADGGSLAGVFSDGDTIEVTGQPFGSVNGRLTVGKAIWDGAETFKFNDGIVADLDGLPTDHDFQTDWVLTHAATPVAMATNFALPSPYFGTAGNTTRAYQITESLGFSGVDRTLVHQALSPNQTIRNDWFSYRAQVWIWNPWATRPTGHDTHTIGLFVGDNMHGVWFTFSAPNQVTSVSNNGGRLIANQLVNDGWWRLEVAYVVGDGEPDSVLGEDNTARIHFGNFATAPGASVICFLPPAGFTTPLHRAVDGSNSLPGVMNVWPVEDIHDFRGHQGNTTVLSEIPGPPGFNAMHILYQIMFETPPHGRGLDPSLFDLQSMEDVAKQVGVEGEELRSHTLFQGGESYDKMIGNIMLDLGLVIPWDFEQGKYKFVLVREQDPATVPIIPEEWVLPELPEIKTAHRTPAPDRLVFGYPKEPRYRDEPVTIDDDAKAIEGISSQNASVIRMVLPTESETAAKIAERRAAEELDSSSSYDLKLHKDGRLLKSGDHRRIDPGTGIQESLLVASNKPDGQSGKADVLCTTDTYALGAQQINPPEGLPGPPEPLLISPQWDVLEAPPQLSEGRMVMWVPFVPLDPQASAARLWASQDDSSFSRLSAKPTRASAMLFTVTEWAFDGSMEEYWSPPLSPLELDYPQLVLQNDDQWRDGRMSVLVVSDAGFEVVFVRGYYVPGSAPYPPPDEVLPGGLEPIDEEQVNRFGDVIRGRLGTQPLTHPAGARCYVINYRIMSPITDSFVREGKTQYFKLQSRSKHSTDDVSVLSSKAVAVDGAAVRLPDVCGLRQTGSRPLSLSWATGSDVDVAWTWKHHEGRKTRTGAGYGTAGIPVGTLAPIRTLVEVKNSSQVLVRTFVTEESSWLYPISQILADIGAGQIMHIEVSNDVPEAAVSVLTLEGE